MSIVRLLAIQAILLLAVGLASLEYSVDYANLITTTITTTDGDVEICAFPVASAQENATATAEMRFVSIGQPALVAFKQSKTDATAQQKMFQWNDNGFVVYLSILSDNEKAALANAASEKYRVPFSPSQIKRLILDELRCSIEVSVNGSTLTYAGKTFRNHVFPLRVEFRAPSATLLRMKFEEVVNSGNEITLDCVAKKIKQSSVTPKTSALFSTSSIFSVPLNNEDSQFNGALPYVKQFRLYTSSVPIAEITIEALVEKKMYELRNEFESKYQSRLDEQLRNVSKLIAAAQTALEATLSETVANLTTTNDKLQKDTLAVTNAIAAVSAKALGECKICSLEKTYSQYTDTNCRSGDGWVEQGAMNSFGSSYYYYQLLCKKAA